MKQRERTISLKSLNLFNLHLPRQCCIEASSLSEKLQNIAVIRLVGLVYINNFKTDNAEAVCCIIIAIAIIYNERLLVFRCCVGVDAMDGSDSKDLCGGVLHK